MTTDEVRALIEASELFDASWYLSNYTDVKISGFAPADHYLRIGAELGRDPSRAFSTSAYLKEFPDVAATNINPLYHYLKWGRSEGRRLPRPVQSYAAPVNISTSRPNRAMEYADSVAIIEQATLKLWGGYSRRALPMLEALKMDQSLSNQDRADVAFNLMQWYYVAADYRRAYENVELSNLLSSVPMERRYVITCTLCLIKLRRFKRATTLLQEAMAADPKESDYLFLMAAIVRMTEEQRADDAQMEWLAKAFVAMDLAPIEKKRRELPLSFDNIIARPLPSKRKQDWKVSIIIPAYSAESTITYAIESLQLQTWRNIEIIIVDDFSPDSTCDVIEKMAREDNRIKLIRKATNEGAYPARNTGLEHVTGDLIMIHDSDDWSHPEKIEKQIIALKKNPSAVGVMSAWIRVDDDFIPSVHSRPRNSLKSLSFPSLLFKKEVIKEIGPWPNVRVSGDAEFKTRIERHYGESAIVRLGGRRALSISLSREDSLTQHSATHINSLHFGLRWHYRALYNFLHSYNGERKLKDDGGINGDTVLLGNRSKRNSTIMTFDYVYVSDFASESHHIKLITSACKAGKKIAIFHWRDFADDISAPLSDEIYQLCLEHSIVILSPLDAAQTKKVVFLNVEIAQELQDGFPNLLTEQVAVLIDRHCDDGKGTGPMYDMQRIQSNMIALFEENVSYFPTSQRIRELMESDSRYPIPSAHSWTEI